MEFGDHDRLCVSHGFGEPAPLRCAKERALEQVQVHPSWQHLDRPGAFSCVCLGECLKRCGEGCMCMVVLCSVRLQRLPRQQRAGRPRGSRSMNRVRSPGIARAIILIIICLLVHSCSPLVHCCSPLKGRASARSIIGVSAHVREQERVRVSIP
jgi:hypothetical protein